MTRAIRSRSPGRRSPGSSVARRAHARRTPSSLSSGCRSIERAARRTTSFASSVRYSTGDLPSIRARNSAGSSWAARCSSIAAGSQSTPPRYDSASASNDASSSRSDGRHPQRLQQQVIQAKRQIECRITEPRAFGIEKDRAVRAEKDVLRADVAVHDGQPRSLGPLRERFKN